MKIYFVANARMPSQKAYGIHIAKMCEALIEAGHELSLVVPSRAGGGSLKDFYGLRVEVPLVRVRSVVFERYERAGFFLMGLSFMLSSLAFLRGRKLAGEKFLIYTVDMDTFSHALLPLAGPVVAEFHSPKRPTFLARFFFKRARVVATNPLIAAELEKTFGLRGIPVEPNGVDESFFDLPRPSGRRAVYVGRFYAWKGLEILPEAARLAPDVEFRVVGGSREEFQKVFGSAEDLQFADVPYAKVKDELAQAGVLLLTGTAKNQDSNRYTAPMKVFEYLATGKPVVASRTEALASLVPEALVRYCPPDDAVALAGAVQEAFAHPGDRDARIAFAREHTWRARAERIATLFTR